MKDVRIKFVDFWDGFNEKNNFIVTALEREYRHHLYFLDS